MIAKILIALLSFTALVSAQAILASPKIEPKNKNNPPDTPDIVEFKKFLTSINKDISSPDDFNFRLNLYLSKKKEIDAFNKLNLGFKKGLNLFSIMTDEEKSMFQGERQSDPENAPTVNGADINEYEESGNLNRSKKVKTNNNNIISFNKVFPQKKDWAAEGKITPAKFQKACGSCWAFATVAGVEAAYLIKHNQTLDLSEQELVDCSQQLGSNGCNGGFSQGALEYFKAFGVSPDSSYKYTGIQGSCKKDKKNQRKIKSFTAVPPGDMLNYINSLRLRPIISAIHAANVLKDYKSGVIDARILCSNPSKLKVNHAVLAVGYDLSANPPYIKFKNSWGTGWGESGFFRISMEKVISQDGPCNLLTTSHTQFPNL